MKQKEKRKQKPASTRTLSNKTVLWGILIITAIVFSNSLTNGFVTWDDNIYVVDNPLIKDLSPGGIQRIFTTFHGGGYYPLTTLSYAMEYSFFELNPTAYHATNLALHLLNVYLVFQFILMLSGRVETAGITALFFGIHPMRVESVVWVTERKGLLFAVFFLAALIYYYRYAKNTSHRKPFYLCIVFSMLAMLSKSAAASVPLVMLLIDYYVKRPLTLRLVIEKTPLLVLSLLFSILALKSQGSAGAMNSLDPYSLVERILIPIHNIFLYLWKAFLPIHLSPFYAFPSLGGMLPATYYIAPVVLLIMGVFVAKAEVLKRDLVFGFLFFLANLFLVIQIVSFGQTVAAERHTYIPYIGLFFIAGQFYSTVAEGKILRSIKPVLQFVFVTYALIFCVITWQRNPVWKDSLSLFSDMIEKEPTAPTPYKNRGLARYRLNDFRGAIDDFTTSMHFYSNDVELYSNRGASYFALNDIQRADADFDVALTMKPEDVNALVNSGNAKAMRGDLAGSMTRFNKAIALDPRLSAAYYNRGQLKLKMQQQAAACEDWRTAVALGYPEAAAVINKYCR